MGGGGERGNHSFPLKIHVHVDVMAQFINPHLSLFHINYLLFSFLFSLGVLMSVH